MNPFAPQITAVVPTTITGDPDMIANALRRAEADGRLHQLINQPSYLPGGQLSLTVGMTELPVSPTRRWSLPPCWRWVALGTFILASGTGLAWGLITLINIAIDAVTQGYDSAVSTVTTAVPVAGGLGIALLLGVLFSGGHGGGCGGIHCGGCK